MRIFTATRQSQFPVSACAAPDKRVRDWQTHPGVPPLAARRPFPDGCASLTYGLDSQVNCRLDWMIESFSIPVARCHPKRVGGQLIAVAPLQLDRTTIHSIHPFLAKCKRNRAGGGIIFGWASCALTTCNGSNHLSSQG